MWNKSSEEVISRIEILDNRDFIYAIARTDVFFKDGAIKYKDGNAYMVYLSRDHYFDEFDVETIEIVYHIMGDEVSDDEYRLTHDSFYKMFSTGSYERNKKLNQLGI
jgi:hypothetical protein